MAYIKLIPAILLSFIFTSFSCESNSEQQAGNEQPEEEQDLTYSYLALGDSYTIGQGVEENLRWPNQLSNRLNNSGYPIRETKIIARTGWTTRDLIEAIRREDLQRYDMVSLLIGVNNQYQGKPFEQFTSELDTLINMSFELLDDDKRFLVVSIPDYSVTPFATSNKERISKELDQYNKHTEKRCKELNIPYINITDISRTLGNSEGALASDSLHPSGLQYLQWVDKIYPEVVEILAR